MKISTSFFKIIAFFVLILSAFSSQLHAQTVSFTSAAVAQANENISNVYTAQASTTSGTIDYSLETGGDESLLAINSSTGLVTLKLGYIDYETKTVYNFTVKATAGSTSVTQAVRVDIINAIVEGGSLNSKKFQLSPALLQNYLEDGVIDLYDDNPSFSGKGVSGNQVYIEIFKDPTTLSYATMRMSCPYTSSGTCASIFGSNYDGSTVSLPANNMGSYPFSGRGGGWQGGAVVDSNGNWSTNFGQTSNFMNMGGVDFWGEKDAPSQGIGKGYWVLEPGDYYVVFDYEFVFKLHIRPQAPLVDGILYDTTHAAGAELNLAYPTPLLSGHNKISTYLPTPLITGASGGYFKEAYTYKLEVNGKTYTGTADASGNWQVQITDPLPQGQTYAAKVYGVDAQGFSGEETRFTIEILQPNIPVLINTIPIDPNDKYTMYMNSGWTGGFQRIREDNPVISGVGIPGSTITVKLNYLIQDNKYPTPPGQSVGSYTPWIDYNFDQSGAAYTGPKYTLTTTVGAEGAWSVTVPDTNLIFQQSTTQKYWESSGSGGTSQNYFSPLIFNHKVEIVQTTNGVDSTPVLGIINVIPPVPHITGIVENTGTSSDLKAYTRHVTLYGTGEPNKSITITLTGSDGGKTFSTTVDANGNWSKKMAIDYVGTNFAQVFDWNYSSDTYAPGDVIGFLRDGGYTAKVTYDFWYSADGNINQNYVKNIDALTKNFNVYDLPQYKLSYNWDYRYFKSTGLNYDGYKSDWEQNYSYHRYFSTQDADNRYPDYYLSKGIDYTTSISNPYSKTDLYNQALGYVYTKSATKIITGKGEPGATIIISYGATYHPVISTKAGVSSAFPESYLSSYTQTAYTHNYSTTVASDGTWSITVADLPVGETRFMLKMKVPQSNSIPFVEMLRGSIIREIDAPVAAVLPVATYNDKRPMLVGTAEPNAKVTLTIDGHTYIGYAAEEDGVFNIAVGHDLVPLTTYPVSLFATDRAGNDSPVSTSTVEIKADLTVTYIENSNQYVSPWAQLDLGSNTSNDIKKISFNLPNNYDFTKERIYFNQVNQANSSNEMTIVQESGQVAIKKAGTIIAYLDGFVFADSVLDYTLHQYLLKPTNSKIDIISPTGSNLTYGDLEFILGQLSFITYARYDTTNPDKLKRIFILQKTFDNNSVQDETFSINLIDGQIPSTAPVTSTNSSAYSDTHRKDRFDPSTAALAVYDEDLETQFKFELVKIKLNGVVNQSVSGASTTDANGYIVLNNPIALDLNSTSTFTSELGGFAITPTSAGQETFDYTNEMVNKRIKYLMSAVFTPGDLNVYDQQGIYVKYVIRATNLNDSNQTPLDFEFNFIHNGVTDEPVIIYTTDHVPATITKDNIGQSGIDLYNNADFDPVDVRRYFTQLKASFTGFNPNLQEGLRVDGQIINIAATASTDVAPSIDDAGVIVVTNAQTDTYISGTARPGAVVKVYNSSSKTTLFGTAIASNTNSYSLSLSKASTGLVKGNTVYIEIIYPDARVFASNVTLSNSKTYNSTTNVNSNNFCPTCTFITPFNFFATTTNGFQYKVDRTGNTANLTLRFPPNYDKATATSFFENLTYDIRYKNSVILTPGTRTVSFSEISKSTSGVDATYPFVQNYSFDVEGNAEIIFEHDGPLANLKSPKDNTNYVTPYPLFVADNVFNAQITNTGLFNGYTLVFEPTYKVANVDNYVFNSPDVTISSGTVVMHGQTIGTIAETSTNYTITFNANAAGTDVVTLLHSFSFFNTSDEPRPEPNLITWTFSGIAGTSGGAKAILVLPQNDPPQLSFNNIAVNVSPSADTTANITKIFQTLVNGTLTPITTTTSLLEEAQSISYVKLAISGKSSTIGTTESLKYNGTVIPIGVAGTVNTTNLTFEVTLSSGIATVKIMNAAALTKDQFLTALKTIEYSNTNAGHVLDDARYVALAEIKDNGNDDGVSDVSTRQLTSSSTQNKVTINFVKLNAPPYFVTGILPQYVIEGTWRPKTSGNSSETTYTWNGPGSMYGVNAAPYSSTTILEYEATKGSHPFWGFTTEPTSTGINDVGQYITDVTVTLSNVLDSSNEFIIVGGTSIPLTGTGTGTVTLSGVTLSYSKATVGTTVTIRFSGLSTSLMPKTLLNAIYYNNSKATPTAGTRIIAVTELKDNINDAYSTGTIDYTNSATWYAATKISPIAPVALPFSINWKDIYTYNITEGAATTKAMTLVVNGTPAPTYPFTYNGVSSAVYQIGFKNTSTNSTIIDSRYAIDLGTSGKLVKNPSGLPSGYYLILPVGTTYTNGEYTFTLSTVNNALIDGNYTGTISLFDSYNSGNTSFNSSQPSYIFGDIPAVSIIDDEVPVFTASTHALSVVEGQSVTADLSINIFPATNNQGYELDVTSSGANSRLSAPTFASYFRRTQDQTTYQWIDNNTVRVTFTAPQNTDVDGNVMVPITFAPSSLYYLTGNAPSSTRSFATTPPTTAFSGMTQTINVTVIDDDVPLIVPSLAEVNVTEAAAGRTSTVGIKLSAAPAGNVTVNLSSPSTDYTISPSSLTFTSANYSTAQTVTVTAIDNAVIDGTRATSITMTDPAGVYNQPYAIKVNVIDDDARLMITNLKNGGTYPTQTKTNDFYYSYNLISNPNVTFQVALPAQPIADVTITYAIPDVSLTAFGSTSNYTLISSTSPSTKTLTFTTSNWNVPQTVTLQKANNVMISNLMSNSSTSAGIINNTGTKIVFSSAMGSVSNPYPSETIYYDMLKEPLPTLGSTLTYSWGSTLSSLAICNAVNGAAINYQLTAADLAQLATFGLTANDLAIKIQLPYTVPVKNAAGTAYLTYPAGNGFNIPTGTVATTNSLSSTGSVTLVNGAMGTSYMIDPVYTSRVASANFDTNGLAAPIFSQNLLKAVYTPAIPAATSTAFTTIYLKNNPAAVLKTFSSNFNIYQGVADCTVSTPVITSAYPDNVVGTVTNAPANAVVTAYASDQTTVIGTGIVTSTGTFQVSFTSNQTIGAQVYVKVQSWALSPISLPVTVQGDNVAPNPPTIVLDPASDSGSSNSDLVTKITLPTIKGFTEGNATVKIYDDAATPNLVATVAADAIGNYTYTFTSALIEGVKTFKATATDATGNVSGYSATSLVFTIDTTPPVASFTAPYTNSPLSSIVTSSEFLSTNVLSFNGANYTATILPVTTCSGMPFANNFGGGWYASTINQSWCNIIEPNELLSSQTITLTVTADRVFDGTNYKLKIYYGSGNTLFTTQPFTKVSTGLFTFTIPAQIFANYGAQGLKYSIEGKDKYSTNYYDISSGSGTLTATPTYYPITIDATNYYTKDSDVTTKVTGTPSFPYTYTLGTAITTTGNYTASIVATDLAGNSGTYTQNYLVPLPSPTIQLATASDSGTWNNDKLTNQKRPQFVGTGPLNTNVKITINGQDYIGAVDGSGNYAITPTADVPQGNYTVSAIAIDANNNQSLPATTTVTIDLTLPVVTATGPLTLDGQNPTLSGQAEIFSVVSATINGTTYTTTLGAATTGMPVSKTLYYGNYTINQSWFNILEAHEVKDTQKITITELADNFNYFDASYRIKIMDTDGTTVVSTISPSTSSNGVYEFPISISLMNTLLTKSYPTTGFKYIIEGLRTSDHTTWSSIVSSNDGALVFQSPITGTNSYSNDSNIATVLTQNSFPSVAWTIPITVGAGTYPTVISTKDWAGNINTLASINYTKNVYVAPPTLRLDASTDTGFMNSDGITNTANPMLSGTVGTGLMVQLYASDGTTTIGSPITPDGSGNWSYTFSGLAAGTYTYKAKAVDGSGNSSTLVSTSIVIDLTAPVLTASNMSIDKSTMLISGTAEQFTKVSTTLNSINYSGIQKAITCTTVGGSSNVVPSWCKYLEHYETMIDQTVKLYTSNLNATGRIGRITFTLANATTQSYDYTITNSDIASTTATITIPATFLQSLNPTDYPSGISYTTSYYNGSAWISLTGSTYTGVIPLGGLNQYYSNDNITTPTLTTTPATTAWSFTLPSTTPDGTYNATVSVVDVAGNQTSVNVAYLLVSPPTIYLDSASDSGSSNFDLITKITTPTLKGIVSIGNKVQLYDSTGVAIGSQIVPDGSGNWNYTFTNPLTDGITTFTAKAVDVNGNFSTSATTSFTIDTQAPAISSIALSNTPSLTGTTEMLATVTASSTAPGFSGTTFTSPPKIFTPITKNETWGTNWSFSYSWGNILEPNELNSDLTMTVTLNSNTPGAWQFDRVNGNNLQMQLYSPDGTTNGGHVAITGTRVGNTYTFVIGNGKRNIIKANSYPNGIPFSISFNDVYQSSTTWVNIQGTTTSRYYIPIQKNTYYSNDANTATVITGTPTNTTWTIPLTAGDYSSSDFTITATDLAGNIGTLTYAPIGAPVLATSNGTSVTGTAQANSTVSISMTSGGVTTTATVTANGSGVYTYTPSSTLVNGTTISATATDASGNVSPVSNTVTVDSLSSLITGPSGSAGSATSAKSIAENSAAVHTFTANETVSWSLNGGEEATKFTINSSGVLQFIAAPDYENPTDGTTGGSNTYVVIVKSTDTSGNISNQTVTVTVTDVDEIAPTAPVVSAMVTNDTTPTITGTAEANSSVSVVINGQTYTTTTDSSGNWSATPTTALVGGTYTASVTATDAAGNTSSAGTASIVIDTTAPTAPVVTAMITNDTTPTITGTAEANSSISVVINGQTYTTTADSSGNWSVTATTALTGGTYTASVTATDAAGNTSSAGTASIVIDTTAPTAPVVTAMTTNDTTPTITGTAEANSSVSVVINGQTYTTTVDSSGNWSATPTTALTGGTYTASVTATDAAGNTSSAGTASIVIDTTAPTAPVVTAMITNDTTPTITGTAEANSSVSVVVNGQTYTTTTDSSGNWSVVATTALAGGTYTASVTATDAAGNTSSAGTASIVIDTTAPNAPTIDSIAINSMSYGGTAEANSTITLTLNGTSFTTTTNGSGRWDITLNSSPITTDGTYSVSVTATDAAGNTSNAGTSSLLVDTTAPTAPVLNGTNGTVVTGTAEANSTVTLSIVNGGTTTTATVTANGSGNFTYTPGSTLPTGVTVTATATDTAGNASANSNTVTSDSTPPSAPVVSAMITNDTTPTITGTAEANSSVSVVVNGQTYTTTTDSSGNWSATPTTALAGGTYTASVTATDAAGNTSSAGSASIVIDTTAPTAPVVSAMTTNDTSPTITGTAEANSSVSVVVNGQTYTATTDSSGNWSATPTIVLTGGTYTASVTATDAAGNTSSAGTASIVIDTTAPNAPTIDSIAINSMSYGGTAEANSTITLTLNGTSFTTTTNGSGRWDITLNTSPITTDGTYSVSVTATDAAGNTSNAGTSSLLVDTTAPTSPIVSAMTTNDTTPTIIGTAEANSSISVVINGQTYTTTTNSSGNWSATPTIALTGGTYTASVTATDAAGNTSSAGTASIVIDTTAPNAPTIDSIAINSMSYGGTAEANSTITLTLNGTSFTTTTNGSGRWDITLNSSPITTDGTYSVSVTATDAAGNISNAGTSSLLVDTTSPTAPVLNGTNGTVVTGTAEANSTVTLSIVNGGTTTTATVTANGSGNFTYTPGSTLPTGVTVTATATDTAGNASANSNTVTSDSTPPSAPVVSAMITNDTTPTITGTAEANSSVSVVVNGQTYTTTTDSSGNWSATPTTALAGGTYTASVTATDAAGNTSSAGSASIVIDTTAPTAPVVSAMTTNDTSPTITGTAEANSSVSVVINGQTYTATTDSSGNWSATPTIVLTGGTYTASVTATDAAGNTSSAGTASIVIDTTAPSPPVVSGMTTNDTTPTITGTAEVNSLVSVVVNGQTYTTTADSSGNWSVTATTALTGGTYTASVTATDAVGNTSSAGTASIVIDTTAPSAPVLNSTNGTIVAGTAEANSTVTLSIVNGGTTTTATVTANSLGNFTYTPGSILATGVTVTATATDAAGNVSGNSNTVTVDATAALITGPSGVAGSATSAKTIAENSTAVHTFTANETVGWSLNGGEDATKFSISNSGALQFIAAPDYETPTDGTTSGSNTYIVIVKSIDTVGNVSNQTVTVTVTNVDEVAPTFSSSLTSTVQENQNVLYTAIATDTDYTINSITYSLKPATGDVAMLSINANTGLVTLASGNLDYETKTSYSYTVIATDAIGNSTEQSVTTTVTDIDEIAPNAPVLNSTNGTVVTGTAEANSTVTLSIVNGGTITTAVVTANGSGNFTYTPGSTLPTGVTVTATATDAAGNVSANSNTVIVDASAPSITGPSGSAGASTSAISINENTMSVYTFTANKTVSWSLNGGEDAAKFSISNSGALQFITAPDFENPTDGATTGSNTYIVDVKSTDTAGNVSIQTVTVTVLDVDDTPPAITGPSGAAGATTSVKTIMENSVGIHLFTANETATWSISGGTESSLFTISAAGKLIFTGIPDYENPLDIDHNNTYEVVVKATDTAGNFSIQTVTVTIANTSDYTIPLLDSDSDAIDNSADLDDDNDGVLDITEMCTAKLNFTGLTTGGTTYTLGNNSVTQAKSTGATFSGDVNGNLKIQVASSTTAYSNVYLDLNFTKPTVLQFVHGTNTGYGNFDAGDVWELVSTGASYTIADPNGDVTVTNNTAGTMTFGSLYPANSTNINEPWLITTSAVTSIRVKLVRGNPASNIKIKTDCNLDTDNDGVINSLDLDSDGDNCPDAKESGVTGVLVSDAEAQGPYGANGLADGIETGTEIGIVAYTSTYATQALVADNVPPTITTQPINTVVFEGNPLQLSVSATAVSGRTLTYQWYKGSAAITGATSATYVVAPSSSTNDVANYYCVISYLNSCLSTTSNVVGVTVVSQPVSDAKCENLATTFSVVPSSTSGVSYQWTKDGVNLNGATSSSITISNLNASDSGEYKCKVTLVGHTEISNGAQLTVYTNNKYTVANQTLCSGLSPFTLNASNVVGTTGSTMIKWQRSVDNGVNWVDVSGSMDGISYSNYTTNALVFSELPISINGYQYRIVSANGNCTETSNGAILTVNTTPDAAILSTSGNTVCSGTLVTMTSNIIIGNQWYESNALIPGATGQTYATYAPGSYTVRVANGSGCTSSASTANIVTVNPVPTSTILEGAKLAFTNCANSNIILTAQTNVSGPSYQWYLNGTPITGGTNPVFTVTQAGDYTVAVNLNSCSSTSSISKVLAIPSLTSSGSTSICQGDIVALIADATGFANPTYQWQINTGSGFVNVSSNGTSQSYNASLSGDYQVVVLDGGITSISCSISVVVNTRPVVSITSPATTTCSNNPVMLSASTSITINAGYQWFIGNVAIQGATNSTYMVTQSGNYSVLITDPNGCQNLSNVISIIVNPTPTAPTVTVVNPTCTVSTGTITVSSPIGSGLTYSIDGSTYTNTTGVFVGVTSGNYSVTVKNTNGCVSTATSTVVGAQPSTPVSPTVTVVNPTCTVPTGTITVSSPIGSGLTYSIDGSTYTNATGVFVGVASGNYSVTVKNTNGCVSTATSAVVGVQPSTPVSPTVTIVNPTCTAPTGTITVSSSIGSGLTYSIDGSTYTNATGVFVGVTSGNYSVTVKNTNGCVSTATSAVVGVQPSTPVLPIVTVVNPTCAVPTGTITVSSPIGSGLTYSIDGSTYINTTGVFAGVVSGSYTITVKNANGCISSSAISTIASQSSLICDSDGDSVLDTQEVTDNTNPNDYCSFNPLSVVYANTSVSWKNADCDSDGLTNTQEIQIGLDLLNPDTDGDGVKDGQEITDQTNPNNACDSVPVHVTLPFSTSFLSGDCDSDGLTNEKELGSNPTSPTDEDNNGTPDYLEFNNHVVSEDDLEIFNSMTVNGDALNDVFVIRGIENYPDNTLIIYNRWGVEVYNVEGYGQDDKYFRGLSEGRQTISQSAELPKGTYFYILRYVNREGVEKQRSGYLYITK